MTGPLRTTPRTLLVVEDDPDTANLLKVFFTGHSYEVLLAARGSEAIELATSHALDLVLLDIMLPDIDGFQVCQTLRQSPRTSHLPVVFLTEKTAQSDRVAGLSAGAQDYITKPFDVEELRLRVHNFISRAERDNLRDPRTHLPTGRLIDEQLQRFSQQPGWHLLDCKIEAFRPFVDVNGFMAGDEVLKFAAHLLRDVIDEHGTPNDFVGQPANDVFLIITGSQAVELLVKQLQDRFNAEVLAHYSFMDREQGHLLIRDKDGQMVQAPLMTLTVLARAA